MVADVCAYKPASISVCLRGIKAYWVWLPYLLWISSKLPRVIYPCDCVVKKKRLNCKCSCTSVKKDTESLNSLKTSNAQLLVAHVYSSKTITHTHTTGEWNRGSLETQMFVCLLSDCLDRPQLVLSHYCLIDYILCQWHYFWYSPRVWYNYLLHGSL